MPRVATSAGVFTSGSRCLQPRATTLSLRKKRPVCTKRPSLLWIDDYKPGLELYRAMFESMGYKVFTASSGEEGVRLAISRRVDVVVTDYEMPGMNGDAVTERIKAANPQI